MKETRAEYLPIQKLRPFEGHPFKVTDNEEMDQLVWSVLTQGLLTPLVVRPLPNGEYEVVSGHQNGAKPKMVSHRSECQKSRQSSKCKF